MIPNKSQKLHQIYLQSQIKGTLIDTRARSKTNSQQHAKQPQCYMGEDAQIKNSDEQPLPCLFITVVTA